MNIISRMKNKKFIKYVYNDSYKAPEAIASILKEEGLTEKQISKCMRKRDKYLENISHKEKKD